MPTPQELAYTKAAQAVNSIIAAGNQPDTATLANLAKAKKALATIGKDPTKAGGVATALTQNDEETDDYDNHDDVERDSDVESSNALKQATRVAIDEFETGEHYAEIIDGVAEEYGVDPIELAKSIHSIGAISDDELNEFINYVEATPGEDAEFDDEERHGDANGRWSDKRTGRSHRDDQGDDEDAETAFEATDIKELPSSVSKMTQKNNKVSDSWSTHHVDGKIGEGEIDGEIDAKGKSYKIYGAADGVPDTADTIPVPVKPVPVDSKVTKNVGKVLFATGKDSYKAPKGVMRDFRKL